MKDNCSAIRANKRKKNENIDFFYWASLILTFDCPYFNNSISKVSRNCRKWDTT